MASHSLFHNIIAKGTLNIFNVLMPVIITPYVYRVLGPLNMGAIEYSNALYLYFGMLGLLGTYNYGLREISANRNNRERVRNIYKNLFVIGICSNLFFLACYAAFIYFFIIDPTIRLFSWILCGNLVSQIFYVEWYNEAMEEFKFITLKTVIIRSISIICIFIFVRSENDAFIYMTITVMIAIVNYWVSYIYSRMQIRMSWHEIFSGLNFKPFIVPLLTILILNNTGILYTVADRTFLGHFTGEKSVAFFSIGQKIVELTKIMILSVVFATLPRLSLYLKENIELYKSGIIKIMRLVIALIVPTAIGLYMLSEQIIWLFGGPEYMEAVEPMKIFSLRIILLGVEAILFNQIIFLHGKEKSLVLFNLVCGGINVILNLFFIDNLTATKSIFFTFLSEIVFEAICIVYIHRYLKISTGIFRTYNLRYIILSCTFIPVILAIQKLSENNIIILSLSFIICITVYFGCLCILKDNIVIEIKQKLFHKKTTSA